MSSIRIWESLFALPFAYIALILASHGLPSSNDILWVTIAMITARTFAMCMNRLANEKEDGINPRTMNRHLQSGLLNRKDMWTLIIPSSLFFIVSAYMLNTFVLILAPFALGYIAFYSFSKYFTWMCNIILGSSLAIAPVGAWFGVTGTFSYIPLILGLAVTLWASGFDIIYACLDYDFDTENGINSIPSKFGISGALKLTKFFHGAAILSLIGLGIILNLNAIYFIGCTIASILLAYENILVKPTDLSKVNIAFFRINGLISMILLVFTATSVMII